MTDSDDARSFEELVGDLEALVQKMERDDLSLEDALDAYQKGVALARAGHARLDAAERRLEALGKRGEVEALDPNQALDEDGPP